MAFLTQSELKTKKTVEIINLITNSDESTVNDIISEKIDMMKSYLFKYYNVDSIFSAAGTARSKVVLMHLKSLVIVDIYEIRDRSYTEATKIKYEEAMRWLEKMAAGSIEANLPLKQIDTDGDGTADSNQTFLKTGSNKKYRNHF
jgi:phage gp36-like protein